MKKKLILTLSLLLSLSSCNLLDQSYNSKRHPQADVASSDIVSEEDSTQIQYVTSSSQEDQTQEEEITNYTVETNVNLRLEPSTDANIVKELEPGANIEKLAVDGDWTRVRTDGSIGYVLSELLVPVNNN